MDLDGLQNILESEKPGMNVTEMNETHLIQSCDVLKLIAKRRYCATL